MFLVSVLAVGGVVITGCVVGRSLFVSALPKSAIPLKYVLPPVALVVLSTYYATLAVRFRTSRLLSTTSVLVAVALLVFRALLATPYATNLVLLCALFIFLEVAGNLVLIQFWTFASELFNPREAKRVFGLIAAGGPLASILFGGALQKLARLMSTADLLFIVVGCLLATALLVQLLAKSETPVSSAKPKETDSTSFAEGMEAIKRSPLLLSITVLVVFCFLTSNISDYQLDLALQREYRNDGQGMVGFLGSFRLWTGLIAAAIQVFLAEFVLSKLGIRAALLLLPLGMLLGSVGVLATGGLLWAVAIPRAVYLIMRYTLNETALNLLYLPLAQALRNQARVLITGVLNPAAVCFLGLIFVCAAGYDLPLAAWSIPILVISLVWLKSTGTAAARYVVALASSIKKRQFDPEALFTPVDDETTTRVVFDALDHPRPEHVIHGLSLLKHLPAEAVETRLPDLLEHSHDHVRLQSLRLLQSKSLKSLLEAVRERLADPCQEVQQTAIDVYCSFLKSKAIGQVKPFLEGSSLPLKAAAIIGLVRHGGLNGVLVGASHLQDLLKSEHGLDRSEGCRILGELGARGFYEPLLVLLDDPLPAVRLAAVRAAEKLGTPELAETVAEKLHDPATRCASVGALVAQRSDSVALVRPRLLDEQEELDVRLACVRVLEGRAEESATEALWEILPNAHGILRTEVCRSLVRLRKNRTDGRVLKETLGRLLREESKDAFRLLVLNPDDQTLLGDAVERRVRESHERLLAVASLLYPQLSLACLRASLYESDERLRAYSVELLDNVLTGEDRDLVFPHFSLEKEPLLELARQRLGGVSLDSTEQLKGLYSKGGAWLRCCVLETVGSKRLEELLGLAEASLEASDVLERDAAWTALFKIVDSDRFRKAQKGKRSSLKGTDFLASIKRQKGAKAMPLSDIEKVVFLRGVPLFSKLSGEELAGIVPLLRESRFPKGEQFIKRGDDGDSLYILVSGKVEVEVEGQETKSLGASDTVGELSILTDEPRSANCSATTEVVALGLYQTDFWQLMQSRPEVAMGMIKVLLKYVA